MSSNGGAGSVSLPAEYVREHARLGYAATEHGNQGDTTTVGIELVSEATTRRGLYVGATRGREENLILVITESNDLDEARDVLERVLTNERADLPAIAQRRALAQEARPAAAPSRPRLQPRCELPAWFDKLMATIGDELRRADDTSRRFDSRRDDLTAPLRDSTRRCDNAKRVLDRHRPALDAADREVEAAQERVWSSNAHLRQSRGLKRRRVRHEVAVASDDLTAARGRQQHVEAVSVPDRGSFRAADHEVRNLMMQLRGVEREGWMALGSNDVDSLGYLRDALFHWRRWAEGRPVTADEVIRVVEELGHQRMIGSADVEALGRPLIAWAEPRGIQARPIVQPAPVERSPDLGIGL